MKKLFLLLSTIAVLSVNSSYAKNDDTINLKHSDNLQSKEFEENIANFFNQMSRSFFENSGFNHRVNFNSGGFRPKTDVYEDDANITVKIDLPGVDKEKVKVEIFQDYVSLKYKDEVKKEEKGETYYISERSFGNFQRIIPIPNNGVIEKAESNYKDGVLTIIMPKSGDAKPKSKVLEI
jgi:HSP20 family protein